MISTGTYLHCCVCAVCAVCWMSRCCCLLVHPVYYLHPPPFFFSLPPTNTCKSQLRSEVPRCVFSASPSTVVRRALHFYREKTLAISSLVNARRIVLVHAIIAGALDSSCFSWCHLRNEEGCRMVLERMDGWIRYISEEHPIRS